ncbi:hypothetical protein [Pontixanthobacter aquaemixtae]|uniref:Uncharacterized protein n=1 Tax=Pontixanthobacter aquaemixtae TaxID=1958940 RepID=A0A844ZVZ3_9SPHN|nr:hypothetical protein [Pontixanthobacter aquaemixtae]MXO91898.1 hypothetical protein [Pontixanthobacter aquaemixtae]
MPAEIDYPAWIMLVTGIYAAAAGIGEWRRPGSWEAMVVDITGNGAVRFLTGIFCLCIGTVLYLSAAWDTSDWMQIAIKIIGGWVVIEGALILAFGDLFMGFARGMMSMVNRFWAGISVAIGLAAIVMAIMRI